MADFTITIETKRIDHRNNLLAKILDLIKLENKRPQYTETGTFTITRKEIND